MDFRKPEIDSQNEVHEILQNLKEEEILDENSKPTKKSQKEECGCSKETVKTHSKPHAALPPPDSEKVLALALRRRGKLIACYTSFSGSLYLGSESFNDIHIPSSRVSRRQLHFYKNKQGCFIESLDEENPIFLNNRELEGAAVLSAEDAVTFNEYRLTLK